MLKIRKTIINNIKSIFYVKYYKRVDFAYSAKGFYPFDDTPMMYNNINAQDNIQTSSIQAIKEDDNDNNYNMNNNHKNIISYFNKGMNYEKRKMKEKYSTNINFSKKHFDVQNYYDITKNKLEEKKDLGSNQIINLNNSKYLNIMSTSNLNNECYNNPVHFINNNCDSHKNSEIKSCASASSNNSLYEEASLSVENLKKKSKCKGNSKFLSQTQSKYNKQNLQKRNLKSVGTTRLPKASVINISIKKKLEN